MKSSRSRSRSKNNRNRSSGGGNVVNRVFDSSGPEGKVRGTPQQIIDKYNQLARDAQLANDRVATENFQQHAEHYLRLLSEAQREMDAKREEQERHNRERQAERDRNRAPHQDGEANAPSAVPAAAPAAAAVVAPSMDPADQPQPDILDASDAGSSLVETPEDKPKPKPRRPRKPKPKPEAVAPDAEPSTDSPASETPGPSEAAE
ncbi:MAG: DUF4167 domain-containing protein [Paracoccaceae bacterium]